MRSTIEQTTGLFPIQREAERSQISLRMLYNGGLRIEDLARCGRDYEMAA